MSKIGFGKTVTNFIHAVEDRKPTPRYQGLVCGMCTNCSIHVGVMQVITRSYGFLELIADGDVLSHLSSCSCIDVCMSYEDGGLYRWNEWVSLAYRWLHCDYLIFISDFCIYFMHTSGCIEGYLLVRTICSIACACNALFRN